MKPPLALLVLVMIGAMATAAEPKVERPNIVFILMDDLGWADLGCYGSNFHETPNLDRLAKQGIRFTHGYAACPVCSPTRASIMTGRYPARLHLTDWLPGRTDRPSQMLLRPKIEQQLALDEVTLAEALKPAGYVSASIGKWHLGGEGFSPEKQGFDKNVGGTQAGSPTGGYFKFKSPTLTLGDDEYLTDRLTEEAEKFIQENKDKPFFLYLAHYAVHIPLQAKKELIDKYQKKVKPGLTHDNPTYAAMIQSMDESVGRIVKKLEDLKIADRTVIFFTSDNGGLSVKEGANTPATSNAPLRAGKGYLYEGGIRTPWIVCWPGTIKPAVLKNPISSVDALPTILDLANVRPPKERTLDGVSFAPLLHGKELARGPLHWHYPHYSNQGGKPGGAIRAGDFKLIEFYEDGARELYYLPDDPGEKTDLAKKQPEVADKLAKMLADWRKEVAAQMPTKNPEFKE